MPSANTLEARVDTWLAAYCQPDAALRLKAIQEVWNREGHLADPPFEVYGHPGLSGAADGLLGQFPGHRFERTTAVDTHHRFARYGWRLVGPDGKAAVEGVDFVELDVDGLLMRVIGFFGANLPSPTPPQ